MYFINVCCYVLVLYLFFCVFFFFKQKTAYEMRISDWSSDVCSSDLHHSDIQTILNDGALPSLPGHRNRSKARKIAYWRSKGEVWGMTSPLAIDAAVDDPLKIEDLASKKSAAQEARKAHLLLQPH